MPRSFLITGCGGPSVRELVDQCKPVYHHIGHSSTTEGNVMGSDSPATAKDNGISQITTRNLYREEEGHYGFGRDNPYGSDNQNLKFVNSKTREELTSQDDYVEVCDLEVDDGTMERGEMSTVTEDRIEVARDYKMQSNELYPSDINENASSHDIYGKVTGTSKVKKNCEEERITKKNSSPVKMIPFSVQQLLGLDDQHSQQANISKTRHGSSMDNKELCNLANIEGKLTPTKEELLIRTGHVIGDSQKFAESNIHKYNGNGEDEDEEDEEGEVKYRSVPDLNSSETTDISFSEGEEENSPTGSIEGIVPAIKMSVKKNDVIESSLASDPYNNVYEDNDCWKLIKKLRYFKPVQNKERANDTKSKTTDSETYSIDQIQPFNLSLTQGTNVCSPPIYNTNDLTSSNAAILRTSSPKDDHDKRVGMLNDAAALTIMMFKQREEHLNQQVSRHDNKEGCINHQENRKSNDWIQFEHAQNLQQHNMQNQLQHEHNIKVLQQQQQKQQQQDYQYQKQLHHQRQQYHNNPHEINDKYMVQQSVHHRSNSRQIKEEYHCRQARYQAITSHQHQYLSETQHQQNNNHQNDVRLSEHHIRSSSVDGERKSLTTENIRTYYQQHHQHHHQHQLAYFQRLQHISNLKRNDEISGNSKHAITPSSLKYTKSAHNNSTDSERYSCATCNKSYATFGGVCKHRQLHCNISSDPSKSLKREFRCDRCPKSYSTVGALKMHVRTHTLPCRCTVCGKAFSRPWLLQGHMRTHTGEKPFSCDHCQRAFADRSNLRAHLQTHSAVKRYRCTSCQKTFSRMSLLLKHQTTCSYILSKNRETIAKPIKLF